MTSVMATKRSIYLFTPERPRDLSARAPGPAYQEYYNIITRPQICLGKKLSKTICSVFLSKGDLCCVIQSIDS